MAVFTLEDEQIIWTDKSSGICPSDVNLCHTVVDLFVEKFVHPVCSSDDLFIQTICSF